MVWNADARGFLQLRGEGTWKYRVSPIEERRNMVWNADARRWNTDSKRDTISWAFEG
jgi:hypothetical protein